MVEDLIKSICDKVLDELKKCDFSSSLFDDDGKLTVAGCLAATYLSSAMVEKTLSLLSRLLTNKGGSNE